MADNMMASVPLAFSEGGDRCKFALPCDAIREIPRESRKVHTERLEAADRWFLRLLGTSQRGRRRVCGSAEEVMVLRASDEAVDFGTSLRGPLSGYPESGANAIDRSITVFCSFAAATARSARAGRRVTSA